MLCGIQTLQSRSAEPPLLFDCDEDEKNPEELEELEDILDWEKLFDVNDENHPEFEDAKFAWLCILLLDVL